MMQLFNFGKTEKSDASLTKKCSQPESITLPATLLGACEGWLARLCGYKHLDAAPEYVQQTINRIAWLLISRAILSDSGQLTNPESLENQARERLVQCLYEYARVVEHTTMREQERAQVVAQNLNGIPTLTFQLAKKK